MSRAVERLRMLGTQEAVAARLGCTRSHLNRVLSGGLRASHRIKEAAQREFQIPFEDWDDEAARDAMAKPAPAGGGPTDPPEASDVRALAARMLATAQAIHSAIEAADMPLHERARQLEKVSGVVMDLGKITGATVLNEKAIAETPAFKRMIDRLAIALGKCGEGCLDAAIEALEPLVND